MPEYTKTDTASAQECRAASPGWIPFLGFRLDGRTVRLQKDGIRRFRRRLKNLEKQFLQGEVSAEAVEYSIMAWWGHAKHANAFTLARDVMSDFPFLDEVKRLNEIRKEKNFARVTSVTPSIRELLTVGRREEEI